MKKLLAMLMAMMMLFGACALAEDDEWTDFDSVILKVMYDSVDEVMESDTSRTVACGALLLDYALGEVLSYDLGDGEYFHIMNDDEDVVFVAPVQANADGVLSLVFLYTPANGGYSVRTTTLEEDDCANALSELATARYTVEVGDVADAAQLLLDAILGEE